MKTPRRPADPLEYTAAERAALVALVLACGIVVAAVAYWPVRSPAPVPPAERAAFRAEVESFVARSTAIADSARAAAAERKRAYAERQTEWERRREGWARERAARAARYADDGRSARRRPRDGGVAIDYSVALPATGSLDANTADSATLLRLGVPVGVVGRWLKYRRAGGRFRTPAEIGKLYSLADSTATRIQAYFAAPAVAQAPARPPAAGADPVTVAYAPTGPLDLNAATAEELERLDGIGAYTAGKIVEYRGWLGGYVSVDQLSEVRGVRAENLEGLRGRLHVDEPGTARRIRVNAATTYDEWRHPYIAWKQAKVLVAFRERHGRYDSPADLLRAQVLTPVEVERLTPYLDFGR